MKCNRWVVSLSALAIVVAGICVGAAIRRPGAVRVGDRVIPVHLEGEAVYEGDLFIVESIEHKRFRHLGERAVCRVENALTGQRAERMAEFLVRFEGKPLPESSRPNPAPQPALDEPIRRHVPPTP